jgi:hypothetical protein
MKPIAVLLLSFISCFAGGGPTGPLPGFVLDPRNSTIRPVFGIPGALQLGPAVPLAFGVVSADFGPNGAFAVAISDEQQAHAYLIRNVSSATPDIADLGVVAAGSTVLGLDSSGVAALLSSPGQLQFLTGLPAAPALAAPVAMAPGDISSAALETGGGCALLGASAGVLERYCADGSSAALLTSPGSLFSAIAIVNAGRDVLLADRAAKQVLTVNDYRGQATVSPLAAASDGLVNPCGLVVNGKTAFVADAGAAAVFSIDLSGQQPIASQTLGMAPSRLKALTDSSILLLNDPSGTPFTIFQTDAMRSFFVPTN